jgi:hypothetical protein
MSIASLIAVTLLVSAPGLPGDRITPRTLPVPGRTAWRPNGCRTVPIEDPILPSRDAFRRAHGDLQSTNEVNLAYAPVFTREWIAEPGLYQVTTPSFDSAGNLYMTPLLPHESILLISLDATTGARRFVVPLEDGDRGGGMVPMVRAIPSRRGARLHQRLPAHGRRTHRRDAGMGRPDRTRRRDQRRPIADRTRLGAECDVRRAHPRRLRTAA